MPKPTWKMKVVGLVSMLRDDGMRVAVPHGEYEMTEEDVGRYKLVNSAGFTFFLSLQEVSHYFGGKELRSESGAWPSRGGAS